jgi:hypothetical protein
MLKRLALGLLTAWAAAGFLHELNDAAAGYDDRAGASGLASWRVGGPETVALSRCVGEARKAIPPGSTVAFLSPEDGGDFWRWRWAAYLLPEDDVISVGHPRAGELAQYAVACRTEIQNPRAVPIRRLPDGWLYEVKPEGTRP